MQLRTWFHTKSDAIHNENKPDLDDIQRDAIMISKVFYTCEQIAKRLHRNDCTRRATIAQAVQRSNISRKTPLILMQLSKTRWNQYHMNTISTCPKLGSCFQFGAIDKRWRVNFAVCGRIHSIPDRIISDACPN